MTGYTEFKSIELKALFRKVDVVEQNITADILHKNNWIATLTFNLRENTVHTAGSFDDVQHLRKHGIDELFIISRVKERALTIIYNKVTQLEVFHI
ncbi:hypothetical protein [Paenibacillus agilis]|uniref:Uncharacterized protein n=1 Tax=Paenibacillus agilis TaxID=3020863 RepID=A0A559J1F2_9BACL|nr:hypothetical protein [Paenibacillus agilis]TVX93718.1 hypothetical protein FPZ44_12010 [Paenibacillus agilis]